MNKNQKRINSITKILLDNEVWLYGRVYTSFYSMRKYVKENIYDGELVL